MALETSTNAAAYRKNVLLTMKAQNTRPSGSYELWAKKRRIWYLTRVKRCRVSFIDHEGVSHAVEVDADSLYEAVGLAIARFGCAEFVRYAPGGEFLVEAREPSSEHRVTLKQFENWMKRSPRGPRDVTVREKITQAIRGSRASQI